MNPVQEGLQYLLPSKKKLTPSGWISFNAPCCHNQGQRPDDRQRGGIFLNQNGGFSYHCFNCGFKTGWIPGSLISDKTKNLLLWMGMSDNDINKIKLYTLKFKNELPYEKKLEFDFALEDRRLPELTLSLTEWLNLSDIDVDTKNKIDKVVDYITKERKLNLEWYDWHYSLSPGYQDRVIIPFYYRNKIVGYTARKITQGKPKYLTDSQPGYIFNIDSQTYNKKYAIIVEGQLDAISIDGVAIMSNDPNEMQCARINLLNKETIVVPDRDRAGSKLIKAALKNNWAVSLPPWETHIKDVADAVANYGRIYTLFTILHYAEHNKLKIELMKRKLESING